MEVRKRRRNNGVGGAGRRPEKDVEKHRSHFVPIPGRADPRKPKRPFQYDVIHPAFLIAAIGYLLFFAGERDMREVLLVPTVLLIMGALVQYTRKKR